MRLLKLTEKAKQLLLKKVIVEATKAIETYNAEEDGVEINVSFCEQTKEKVAVVYTPSAYLKCLELVKHFPGEVGWYGLIRRESNNRFCVYDVLIPEQRVNGARVIDDTNGNDWFESLSDDQLDHLHFQAHSHVNMSTTPSKVDTDNQQNTVNNMGGEGFYVFQIWNKSGDINSFIYDLDNNIFYDKDDVEIIVEDETYETLQKFIAAAEESVKKIELKPVPAGGLKLANTQTVDLSSYSNEKTLSEKLKETYRSTGYSYDSDYWKTKSGFTWKDYKRW